MEKEKKNRVKWPRLEPVILPVTYRTKFKHKASLIQLLFC